MTSSVLCHHKYNKLKPKQTDRKKIGGKQGLEFPDFSQNKLIQRDNFKSFFCVFCLLCKWWNHTWHVAQKIDLNYVVWITLDYFKLKKIIMKPLYQGKIQSCLITPSIKCFLISLLNKLAPLIQCGDDHWLRLS